MTGELIKKALMSRRLMLCIIMGITLSSCSHKGLYQSIQSSQKQECKKLKLSEQADCLSRYEQDYDAYQKQREGVKK